MRAARARQWAKARQRLRARQAAGEGVPWKMEGRRRAQKAARVRWRRRRPGLSTAGCEQHALRAHARVGRGAGAVHVLQVTSRFDGLDRIRSSYRRFDDKISKVGVATRFFCINKLDNNMRIQTRAGANTHATIVHARAYTSPQRVSALLGRERARKHEGDDY